jgi:hypothetical protein
MTIEMLVAGAFLVVGIAAEFVFYRQTGRRPIGLLLGILGFALGLSTSQSYVEKLRAEAVERGYAKVISNPDGSTSWDWISEAKADPKTQEASE